jgi:hypothetical protein
LLFTDASNATTAMCAVRTSIPATCSESSREVPPPFQPN